MDVESIAGDEGESKERHDLEKTKREETKRGVKRWQMVSGAKGLLLIKAKGLLRHDVGGGGVSTNHLAIFTPLTFLLLYCISSLSLLLSCHILFSFPSFFFIPCVFCSLSLSLPFFSLSFLSRFPLPSLSFSSPFPLCIFLSLFPLSFSSSLPFCLSLPLSSLSLYSPFPLSLVFSLSASPSLHTHMCYDPISMCLLDVAFATLSHCALHGFLFSHTSVLTCTGMPVLFWSFRHSSPLFSPFFSLSLFCSHTCPFPSVCSISPSHPLNLAAL